MSKFEFVLVIVSLILGLSITTLLQGMADLYRARHRVQLDCQTWFWVIALLAIQAQMFFGAWGLRNLGEWKPVVLFTFMLGPILLFASSVLLLPRVDAETPSSMVEYRRRDGRFSLLCLAGYHVWAAVSSVFLNSGWSPEGAIGGLSIAVLLVVTTFVRQQQASWVLTSVYLGYAALVLFSTQALR
jgi:hypothetical protein